MKIQRAYKVEINPNNDRFFPSSKTCSVCGAFKKDLMLEDRIYICNYGNVMDRDLNASINLERYGINWLKDTVSSTGIKACGESVSPEDAFDSQAVSVKQEENKNLLLFQN